MAIDEHRGGSFKSFLGFFKVVGGVVAEKVEGRVDERCDGDRGGQGEEATKGRVVMGV